ncbi:hypothetical protein [Rhodococcus kronopolitis]|uniref:Uncharacterized protein n=1 Tax=Rhodococcus kronopolitis TaxID=1460226 RepID=A0ABV9FTN0_9NOCA
MPQSYSALGAPDAVRRRDGDHYPAQRSDLVAELVILASQTLYNGHDSLDIAGDSTSLISIESSFRSVEQCSVNDRY